MSKELRVLVVEDSEDDALLLLREIRKGGYEPISERVDTAGGMGEALDKQDWDIIICDYVMPEFSGPEALRLVQEKGVDLPFIMVSGKIGEDTAVEMMKAGAHDYVMKDNLARLSPAVERELREAQVRRARREADEALRGAYHATVKAINAVTLAISGELSPDLALKTIVEQARQLAGARYAALGIGSDPFLPFHPWVFSGVDEADARRISKIPRPLGLLGAVLQEGRPVRVQDLARDPRFRGFPPHHPDMKSFLGVPIRYRDETIGNLYLCDKIGAEGFSEDDELAIEMLASHAGIAYRQAQLHEQLRTERARLQTIFENAPAGIALVRGPDYVFELANPVYRSILPGKEILATPFAEAWPEAAPQVLPIFERVRQSGQPYHGVDVPRRTRRGAEAPLEEVYLTESYFTLAVGPFSTVSGEVDTILILAMDTTEQVRARKRIEELAEEAWRRAAELAATIESMVDAVFVCDQGGNVVQVNKAAVDLLGLRAKEEATRPLAEYLRLAGLRYPDGRSIPAQDHPLCRALRGETYSGFEYQLERPSGRVVWASASGAPVLDEQGKVIGAVHVARDITAQMEARAERERLHRAVDAQRRLFESVVQSAPAGIAVLHGPAFVYDLVNPTYQAIAPGKQMEGRAFIEVWPEEGPRVLPILEEVIRSQQPYHASDVMFRIQRFPEAPFVEAYFTFGFVPVRVPGREADIVLNLAVETTEQVRARMRIEELAQTAQRRAADLAELDRLKDQFIEIAAHELKTPVTGIKGFAQYLLRRETEGLSPQALRALQAINRQTDRIGALVNDLLDISRLQAGQLELAIEHVDLPILIREIVDRTALTTAKHRIRVVRAEPVVVKVDKNRLEQVLANLLDNAATYSPQGGDIDVAVDRGDGGALVSVRDYGIGIPKEKQARIFQRFYRAHTGTPNDYGGMGVALYISNEIVKRHGGRMWFESEEGKGSTFYFSLPLA